MWIVHAYSVPIKGYAHNQTSIFHHNQFSCTFVISRGGMPLFHSTDGGSRLDCWFSTSCFVIPALSSGCLRYSSLMVQKRDVSNRGPQLTFKMFSLNFRWIFFSRGRATISLKPEFPQWCCSSHILLLYSAPKAKDTLCAVLGDVFCY